MYSIIYSGKYCQNYFVSFCVYTKTLHNNEKLLSSDYKYPVTVTKYYQVI